MLHHFYCCGDTQRGDVNWSGSKQVGLVNLKFKRGIITVSDSGNSPKILDSVSVFLSSLFSMCQSYENPNFRETYSRDR